MTLVVDTDCGRVRGLGDEGTGVRVFRGIPYATVPDRFGPPRRADGWPGTRPAEAFGPAPLQPTAGPFGGVIPGNQVDDVSEDCLTVNVWTPAGAPAGLPVLVWVYGGAFLGGGSSIGTYDAARLCAEQEVVVVSINYRVGALGFLWLPPQATGNAGLLDQIAALEWVQRNIAGFGGDPGGVTIMGESAGGGSVLHLLTSPRAQGLFRRAICQSPGVDHTLTPAKAEVVTRAFLDGLEGPTAAALPQMPAERLLQAQTGCLPALMGSVSSMPFHPVVDGSVVTAKPSAAVAAGAGEGVDLLLTWTADELRLFPNPRADARGRDGLGRWASRYLLSRLGAPPPPERAAELVDHYLASESAHGRPGGAYAWAALQTDGIMRLPARRIAELRAGAAGVTYCAQFSWPARDEPGGWQRGAFHAIDQAFVFGTLDRCGWRQFLGAEPSTGADELSAEVRSAWASFARTGSPASPAIGTWPSYTRRDRATVILDSPCRVVSDPLGDADALWEGLWSVDGGPPPGI